MSEPVNDRFGLVGRLFENRFRVERAVAEGGFGTVYEGYHLALEARVAIKVLKSPEPMTPEARAAFVERFLVEAKTLARLKHPNIVHVIDTGVSVMPNGEQAPWTVLEWIDGKTLSDELAGRGPMKPVDVLALIRPVLEALGFAHDEGIAHRDIKPDNIMLMTLKSRQIPKLLDFGIAKLMETGETAGTGATATNTTTFAFSPYYAAPEQLGKNRTGPWTDVHAMGLVLTEMLTGVPALPRGDLTETFRAVLSETRPTPAKFGVEVGSWELVLAQAVAYRPDTRFKTATELLAALEAALPRAKHVVRAGSPAALGAAGAATGFRPTTLSGSTGERSMLAATSGSRGRVVLTASVVGVLAMCGVAAAMLLRRPEHTPAATATASQSAASNAPVVPATPAAERAAVPTPVVPVAPPTIAPAAASAVIPSAPAAQPAAIAAVAQPTPVSAQPAPVAPVALAPVAQPAPVAAVAPRPVVAPPVERAPSPTPTSAARPLFAAPRAPSRPISAPPMVRSPLVVPTQSTTPRSTLGTNGASNL